ncbi:MAG: 50S ribosomal protein L21 [Candidatus Zixiibacteriota bacterium]
MAYEAVFESGGKQFAVGTGDVVCVPHLAGEIGTTVAFDRVLLVRHGNETRTGQPHVAGATVAAEILSQDRADKVVVFHFRRRVKYRRRTGHRQPQTKVRITAVHA